MLKAFTIGMSRTVNLGNFESARIEASVTIEVPDDPVALENVKAGAQAQLYDLLKQTWNRQMEERQKHKGPYA